MKQKTRSSAKKRFRITGTGKIKVMRPGRKHLLQQKSKSQKLKGKAGKVQLVSPTFKWQIKMGMPYLYK